MYLELRLRGEIRESVTFHILKNARTPALVLPTALEIPGAESMAMQTGEQASPPVLQWQCRFLTRSLYLDISECFSCRLTGSSISTHSPQCQPQPWSLATRFLQVLYQTAIRLGLQSFYSSRWPLVSSGRLWPAQCPKPPTVLMFRSQGVDLVRAEFVPDDKDDIIATVQRLRDRVGPDGIIFSSGGIGELRASLIINLSICLLAPNGRFCMSRPHT